MAQNTVVDQAPYPGQTLNSTVNYVLSQVRFAARKGHLLTTHWDPNTDCDWCKAYGFSNKQIQLTAKILRNGQPGPHLADTDQGLLVAWDVVLEAAFG